LGHLKKGKVSMKEYWEITHDRAVPTQAVWGLQPAFELNNLTRAQHGTLRTRVVNSNPGTVNSSPKSVVTI